MNNKIKKVLKYIGVGAIGFLFGVGSLIGVSSCAQHNNNSNERTASRREIAKREIIHFSDGDSFTFLEDFNYNAFFQKTNQSFLYSEDIQPRSKYPFISFGAIDSAVNYLYIDTDIFTCEGFDYNRLMVRYDMATTDINFYNVEGNIIHSHLIDNHNPYKFFVSLTYQYYNNNLEAVDYQIEVCRREKFANSDGTYMNYNATWISSAYRTIYSGGDEWGAEYRGALMVLEMCNNFTEISGFDNATSDIGLGGAFTLLTTAFSSLIPLMSIQIIPGITIGLLLFIPLITGIILLVIWLVKR